jgi:hypothetical protein
MKSKLLFLLLAITIIACSDNSSKKTTELRFYENSSIEVLENVDVFVVTIGSGNNMVFEYQFQIDPEPGIADSGYSEKILFEINSSLSEFSLSDTELKSIKAYYRQSCFCENTESVEINSGSILGSKINENRWMIDINVNIKLSEFNDPVNKQVSGVFRLN